MKTFENLIEDMEMSEMTRNTARAAYFAKKYTAKDIADKLKTVKAGSELIVWYNNPKSKSSSSLGHVKSVKGDKIRIKPTGFPETEITADLISRMDTMKSIQREQLELELEEGASKDLTKGLPVAKVEKSPRKRVNIKFGKKLWTDLKAGFKKAEGYKSWMFENDYETLIIGFKDQESALKAMRKSRMSFNNPIDAYGDVIVKNGKITVDLAKEAYMALEESVNIEESKKIKNLPKQLKHAEKQMMIVKDGKVKVINKKDWKSYEAKGYTIAESTILEKLSVDDGVGAWIDDFQKSDAPQFKDKTDKEKRDMAIAAFMDAKKKLKEDTDVSDFVDNYNEVMKDDKAVQEKISEYILARRRRIRRTETTGGNNNEY